MGLFKKLFSTESAKVATSSIDTRPEIPSDLLEHFRKECVRVSLTNDGWEMMRRQTQGTMTVKVRKQSRPDIDQEYRVTTSDGKHVGWLSKNDFMRSGCKTRGETTAEVYGPIWAGEKSGRMYIPITAEALERRNLDIWITVSANGYTASREIDELDGEILTVSKESGKPRYIIVAGSVKVCEISSRMKCYEDVSSRAGKKVRRVISEQRKGDNGEYWRVGLYF